MIHLAVSLFIEPAFLPMRTATTLLVFCVAALAALGLVMITSACIGMDSTK